MYVHQADAISLTPPHHPLAGATLAHEPGGGLRVIPAYVAIYERRAGGQTPQHEKQEKKKRPPREGGPPTSRPLRPR